MIGINMVLLQWSIYFLIKKNWWCCYATNKSSVEYDNMTNKESAEKLHKPITRKF